MWTIIRKEFRENWMYLIGGILIVLFCINQGAASHNWTYIIPASRRWVVRQFYSPFPKDAWIFSCAWGAAIIALKLVYEEQWRKTWALLSHLPIGRARMVYGKFLAGFMMYSLLTLPAGALAILRLLTPGVWPGPFYLSDSNVMLFPWLAGACIYIVAFYTAFRPARWYGTKWIPATLVPFFFIVGSTMPTILMVWKSDWQHRAFMAAIGSAMAAIIAIMLWGIRSQALTREY